MSQKVTENISNRRLLVLFGGETGNSEDVAKRVVWESRRRHFDVVLFPFDEYQIGRLVKEQLVVFICATAGQGDEPMPMRKFWKFIMRKDLPGDALITCNCVVIALGDSSYPNYNVVGVKLSKRLKSLGAKLMLDVCLGDDQHDLGYHAAVDPFLEKLWQKLSSLYPLPKDAQILSSNSLPKPTYSALLVDAEYQKPEKSSSPYVLKSYNVSTPFLAPVISNQRVTAEDHFQDVRHIQFQINDEFSLRYNPGDVACIIPNNLTEDIQQFFALTNMNPEDKFVLKKEDLIVTYNELYDTIPSPCTVQELVNGFLGIHEIPKRYFFEILWKLSKNDTEKEKLKEFSTTNGQQELYNYCIRPRRTILEVLTDFPETTRDIPFEYLFDLIPAIKPRSFSIASSLRQHPRQLHVLVAVVNYRTRLKTRRLGLCSNFLSRIEENATVRLWVTKGSIKLPPDECPIIMIGPGTGVAPFRGIIQDRVSKNLPTNFLFFGCRFRQKDFFFEEEWNEAHARGLLYLYTAFSRENPDRKVYVQHKLMEERHLIWELISKCDAYILVAGNANQMPFDVRDTLIRILEIEGRLQSDSAASVIARFETKARLQYDIW